MSRPRSEKSRVLIRETIADEAVARLRERFDVDVDPDSDLHAIIPGYDALIVRSATTVDAELLELGTRLRVIGRAGVGVDNVDLEAASRRGVLVVNAPESTITSASEHAIALLLALARSIPQAHATLKQGRWDRSRFGGIELADKTLGLIGLGRIGQQVARKARAIGMHVIAFDPYVAPSRFTDLAVDQAAELREVLDVDFLSIHAALTSDTRALIGREELSEARDGIRIVNVARGEMVDEEALIEALNNGKVAGAALDVFAVEPYSGPLLELDNVIVTPHLGASTGEAQSRAGLIVAEQVGAALDDGAVSNAVNIPGVAPEDVALLEPYIGLVEKLGALAFALAGPHVSQVDCTYRGRLAERDTRVLTLAALSGAFTGRVSERVNLVNAAVMARDHGVTVHEESTSVSPDFTSLVEVRAVGDDQDALVAATTIGDDNRDRLVHALGYEIEVELDPTMVFVVNRDRPGVIGAVGTTMGTAGINIATMAVSRNRRGGMALMVFSTDGSPEPDVLDELRALAGVADVRLISLET